MTSLEEERKLKVLLVDDSIDDREHFFDLIDEAQVSDFLIQEVDNASLALEKLIAETFDCVVVDYNMPGHNGIWLIEEIGKRELEVASILLTGGGSEKLAVESLKTGTQDYYPRLILKPNHWRRAFVPRWFARILKCGLSIARLAIRLLV